MSEKKQYTRLDAVGGSGGKATVETIVVGHDSGTIANLNSGSGICGSTVYVDVDKMPTPLLEFNVAPTPKKLKIRSNNGKLTIEDPMLGDTLVLQVTDGFCCVRPTEEQVEYVKRIAALLRRNLGA